MCQPASQPARWIGIDFPFVLLIYLFFFLPEESPKKAWKIREAELDTQATTNCLSHLFLECILDVGWRKSLTFRLLFSLQWEPGANTGWAICLYTLIIESISQLSVDQMSSSLAYWNRHLMLYKGVNIKMYLLCLVIVCRQYKKMYQNSPSPIFVLLKHDFFSKL
jgi:hypothetical protein